MGVETSKALEEEHKRNLVEIGRYLAQKTLIPR